MREAAEWYRELPDGRVVTGGRDGRVRLWDPGAAQRGPVELGCHEGAVTAVAVLPDGRVVTGGYDDRVRLRNVQSRSTGTLLACSAHVLATFPSPSGARLFIARCAKSRLGSPGQEANFVVPLADALAVLCGAQPAGTRLRGKVARPADPARE